MSSNEPKTTPPPPSEWMEDAFVNCGGIVGECSCGRTHFEDSEDAGDWSEGELERLRADRTANPDRTIDGGFRGATINGLVFAVGCPCNGMRSYEYFLWDHRRQIAEYLRVRADHAIAAAKLDRDLIGDLDNVALIP